MLGVEELLLQYGIAGVMLFIWWSELRDIKKTLHSIDKALNGDHTKG